MRDGFGRRLGVGLLLVAGAALGQTAGNSSQTAAGKLAQATPAKPAFISATVKPAAQPTLYNNKTPDMFVDASTRLAVYYSMSLKQLIGVAYGVTANDVTADNVSGLAWLDTHLYDIVAKMPAGASVNDAPKMLQTLLKDRFKLAVHTKSKNQQVMALVVAKGGPKLQPAIAGQPDGMTMKQFADLLTRLMPRGGEPTTWGGGGSGLWSGGGINGRDYSEYGGDWKVVVDQTGLKGKYQVAVPSYKDGPIFSSVLKLGLKLQLSTRKVVGKVVVDHAAKMPTAN